MKKKSRGKTSSSASRAKEKREPEAKPKRRINTYWRRDGTKVHGHMRKSFGLRDFLFGGADTKAVNKDSKIWIGVSVLIVLASGAATAMRHSFIPLGIGVGAAIVVYVVSRRPRSGR